MNDAADTTTPSDSWPSVVATTIRLLTFRTTRAELINFTAKHLAFGLLCTWLVGIGRYWDNPRVGLLQHLGFGSVVYVFALSLFLWLIVWPLRPQHWSYFRVLVFVSLVSPPAILYALPVEKFYSLETANSLNVWFLAIVAAWRVAVLLFFLRRLGGLSWFSIPVATLLPLTLIVFTLTVLNLEQAVFEFMGGVRQGTASDGAYAILFLLTFLSVFLIVPLIICYLALIVWARMARRRDLRSMNSENNRVAIEGTLSSQIKLYYDLDLPEARPAPLLIALHGYGANKRQMSREAKALAPEGFAIVSLQGFHQHMKEPKEPGGPLRFGFGWLTNFHPEESVAIHHQALLDLIANLIEAGTVDRERVFLLGFSQTCALNYRFAFTHPNILRGVVGICGGLPGDWETSENYQPTPAALFHLAGTRDEFYPPARVADYEERLRLRAENVEFKSYDAAHEMIPSMREDLRVWLDRYAT